MVTPEGKKEKPSQATLEPRVHRVTLDLPPSVNKMYTQGRNGRILTPIARAYKDYVQLQTIRLIPLEGRVVFVYTMYRKRKSGDLDNILKSLLDSVKGNLYHDDKQIVELHGRLEDDPSNPRVEIVVYNAKSE